MADWWWRVVVVAVVDDNDSAFVAAASALREAAQGGALALLRLLQALLLHRFGVPARPFQGHVVIVELRLHRRGRLLLHRREPRLRLWLDEARRRSGRGDAPAALVDNDAGAASAPA